LIENFSLNILSQKNPIVQYFLEKNLQELKKCCLNGFWGGKIPSFCFYVEKNRNWQKSFFSKMNGRSEFPLTKLLKIDRI